jgi:TM2 domain-containing membrane protein YozV
MSDENAAPVPEDVPDESVVDIPAQDEPASDAVLEVEVPMGADQLAPEPPAAPPVPDVVPAPPVPPAPPAAPPAPPYAGPAAAPAAEKSKVAAGILAILLGGLGIHKFYLGYTKEGVIMLLVSVLSFGLLSGAVAIIALVEGILYLTKSDEEFYSTYVAGKKTWF